MAYRAPRGESVAEGRSRCPSCGHQLAAADNIPVFSYVFLRGRCRYCRASIPVRYPLIEVVTATLFAAAAARFGTTAEALFYAGFFWVLVVLSVVDLEHRLLPDRIVVPSFIGALVALAAIALLRGAADGFRPVSIGGAAAAALILALTWDPRKRSGTEEGADEEDAGPEELVTGFSPLGLLPLVGWFVLLIASIVGPDSTGLPGALVGAALFSGFFFSVGVLYAGGMGFGDVKFSLLLGAATGYLRAPDLIIASFYIAFFVAGIGSLAVVLLRGGGRKTAIPFGPFLALGATLAIFFGTDLTGALFPSL